MLTAVVGTLFTVSCNKTSPQDVKEEQPNEYVQQLDQATKCLNEAYAKMELSELEPVAGQLKDGPLKNLISALKASVTNLGPASISKISQLLSQCWDLDEQSVTVYIGKNVYHISSGIQLTLTEIGHTLTIEKNEEPYFKMVSCRSLLGHNGTLTTREFDLILEHDRTGLNTQTISLTSLKKGDETPLLVLTTDFIDTLTKGRSANYNVSAMGGVIVLDGHVKHAGQFLIQAGTLARILKYGTDEKTCQAAAFFFNENVSINLNFNGSPAGYIYVAPIYSQELENSTIAFMLDSPLFGEEPVDISNAISSLGLDLSDFLGSKESEL